MADTGIWIPPTEVLRRRQAEVEREQQSLRPQCPAASMGAYADTGARYVRCSVEDSHFKVADAPVAAKEWCCGNYQGCPSWQAHRDGDPRVDEAVGAGRERRRLDRLNAHHRAIGLRVDDEGEEA